MSRKVIVSVLILLLIATTVSAALTIPSTYSIGYKIWGKYWDMMGETGIQNGSFLNISSMRDAQGNAFIKNSTVINSSTVTVTRNVNGTVELDAQATGTTILGGGGIIVTTNSVNNYTISGDPFLMKWDTILANGTRGNQYFISSGTWTLRSHSDSILNYSVASTASGDTFKFIFYSPDTLNKTVYILGYEDSDEGGFNIFINDGLKNSITFAGSPSNRNLIKSAPITPQKGVNTLTLTTNIWGGGALYTNFQAVWITDP